MITPLLGQDQLDHAGLERLVEHILNGGVHGLFVLGTTGEAPSLGGRLRREVVERVTKQVAGRVPVLVGVTDTAYTDTLALAGFAADCGADAVVLAPPYYFPNSQPEVLGYFQHVVPRLPLPVFLYNIPTHTKTPLEIRAVRALAGERNIAGIKDSSGDMAYFHELLAVAENRMNWPVLSGREELLGEAVLLGGHGGVCGGANLFPRLYVDLYRSATEGDLAAVRRLHATVMRISRSLYTIGRHGSGFLKGLKCALSLRGICSDLPAWPFERFSKTESERVREVLEELAGEVDLTRAAVPQVPTFA